MKKIFVFLGSRANYASIKSALYHIRKTKNLKLYIVIGASAVISKYGDLQSILKKDGFKIYKKIFFLIEGENPLTMAKSTGLGLIELTSVMDELKPDIVLTVGDRFETMATTIASAYMNIPLAHTMGGEISGTIDESIRHAITKFANIHFPASKNSANRIHKLGEDKKCIFQVGCPRIDLAADILKKNNLLEINNRIFKEGVGDYLDLKKPFLLVSQHPVTTEYEEAEKHFLNTLKAVEKVGIQTIFLWPNADAGSGKISLAIRKWREGQIKFKCHFFKNLAVEDYMKLMQKTSCLVGNSSSGIREGAFIGTPVVNIGTRQDGRERGLNVIDCNNTTEDIYRSIILQCKKKKFKSSKIYGNGTAGLKIARILSKIENIKVQKKIIY
jgi:UDP-hydrolysing UDP-N-acetyl-D-glucosamine 2-epimerase